MKYKDAKLLFSKAQDKKKGKLLELNTRLVLTRKGNFGIAYNGKIIVEILEDDTYIIRNQNKYHSVLLKKINKYSPASLKVKKNNWVLKDKFHFFNGATINLNGELVIPEPYKKYNPNECKKCGLIDAECKCPLSKTRYNKLKKQGEQHEEDYGYFPANITALLARGMEEDA